MTTSKSLHVFKDFGETDPHELSHLHRIAARQTIGVNEERSFLGRSLPPSTSVHQDAEGVVAISEWRTQGHGSIVATFSLTFCVVGLTIDGCLLRESAGQRWISM